MLRRTKGSADAPDGRFYTQNPLPKGPLRSFLDGHLGNLREYAEASVLSII